MHQFAISVRLEIPYVILALISLRRPVVENLMSFVRSVFLGLSWCAARRASLLKVKLYIPDTLHVGHDILAERAVKLTAGHASRFAQRCDRFPLRCVQ